MVWTRRIGGNPRKSVLVYRCSADSKDDSSREYGRSGSWTLSRDEEEEREGLLANDQNGVLMSADFQTLHRDLASWHDLYEWFRSYHVLRCESEVGLQLRRDLCEALRLNDLVEAARLREEILDTDSRNDIVRLRDRLDKAVQIEVFSPHLWFVLSCAHVCTAVCTDMAETKHAQDYRTAAQLRDELWQKQLAQKASRFPKFDVGLIVEHTHRCD
jgi:hypothetical protein